MTMTDPIADMLTRLRNANQAYHDDVSMPYSKLKAGLAEIMDAAQFLIGNPQVKHGTIKILFTPDEEIGRGVHADLPRDLGAAVAYTLDGAHLGEIVYETFSADGAVVKVQGVSIHPGSAKGKLVNALHLAARIVDTLPQATLTPETTDGRHFSAAVDVPKGDPDNTLSRPELEQKAARLIAFSGAASDEEVRKLGLYRAGVLATGLRELDRAERHLAELAGMDYGYRDVSDRLDKIASLRDSG